MLKLRAVMIVDDSGIMQQAMRGMFRPYTHAIIPAAGCREALEKLRSLPALELVICDVRLPDGDGFEVLAAARMAKRDLRFVMTTSEWSDEESERATEGGASGYLLKPIRLADLDRLVSDLPESQTTRRSKRGGPLIVANLLDGTGEKGKLVTWKVRDLSATGAFIETQGPLSLGDVLELEISLQNRTIRATAVVVRIQEPNWMYPGGVGVEFQGLDDDARHSLDSVVETYRRVEKELNRARERRLAVRKP